MRGWNTFVAQTNHGHTWIHKTHHNLDLGEATTFFLIIFFMINHEGCIQMSSCPKTPKLGVSKLLKLGLLTLWKAIISYEDLQLKWGLKQTCSPCQKLSNNMLHVTYTHLFQGDFWLFVGGSQIGTLTLDPFFGHSLCFKYSSGSCEAISNI